MGDLLDGYRCDAGWDEVPAADDHPGVERAAAEGKAAPLLTRQPPDPGPPVGHQAAAQQQQQQQQ